MEFVRKSDVMKIHHKTIEEHGGTHGLRDEGALDSALMAAQNRYYYEEANLAVCAATYAYHLSQAHAFIDGNKRVAAVTAEHFLDLNGVTLDAADEELINFYLKIAASEITRDEVEQQFTAWLA